MVLLYLFNFYCVSSIEVFHFADIKKSSSASGQSHVTSFILVFLRVSVRYTNCGGQKNTPKGGPRTWQR